MAKAAKEAEKLDKMKADSDSDSDSDSDTDTDSDSDSVIGGLDTDTCNFTHDENTMAEAVVEMAKAHGVNLGKLMLRLSAIATQEAVKAKKAA